MPPVEKRIGEVGFRREMRCRYCRRCIRAACIAVILVLIIGFWSRSTYRGGVHSGIPSGLIRQVQPRVVKLWW